jgi:outer membrane lipoprotein-sorting protein
MKKFILTALLLSSVAWLNAQDNSKAKAILNGISQQTKSYSTIDITFTFTVQNTVKKSRDTKTGLACMKGEKYWMSFSGQEIICDEQTVWTYIIENNEVQINVNDTNNDQALNPVKLLTDYNKSYTPKFIKEETRGSKIFQIIDLTPIKAKSFYKIRLEIDKAQKQVVNAIIYDKNGVNVYTYSVTKFVTNKTIPDSKFSFKTADHPGVEVIDLR